MKRINKIINEIINFDSLYEKLADRCTKVEVDIQKFGSDIYLFSAF